MLRIITEWDFEYTSIKLLLGMRILDHSHFLFNTSLAVYTSLDA